MTASPGVLNRIQPGGASVLPGFTPARPGPARISPGRVVVDRVPQLAAHQGSPPQLILRWGRMPSSTSQVDVVVHLHGHSAAGRAMNLTRDKEPNSGLDLVDPDRPGTPGRTSPTLLVLPRGHFYGGRTGHGYTFPALENPGALTVLVQDALRRFAQQTGVNARRGRLILTAHSGGGASLMAILRHVDPDEVHTFDALYTDPQNLITWARRHAVSGQGALRVLYRSGEGTAKSSEHVAAALGPPTSRFRVERTTIAHPLIPRRYGWRLLADPGATLPGATLVGARTGGSTTPTPSRPATPPPPNQGAASQLCDRIAQVTLEQYRRWRPGAGPALRETSPTASPILREYYRTGVGVTVTDAQLQSTPFQASHPWSAVFISYVMKRAGAGSSFRYSAAHQTYIRAAVQNRARGDTSNPFWGFRATELAPRVGDLVCASRQNSGATYDNITSPTIRATHCDVVTEVHPGRIRAIGGNVNQAVGEKWLRTRPDGRLDLQGPQSRFFAVLTCRSGGHTAPLPTPQPVGQSLEARIVQVMRLLVQQYGYPSNGAAGLVGNLIAESGLLPGRIEGSSAVTPMRAKDFTGTIRDFTPDQIQSRDTSRAQGPHLPGVGLAQWTSPARRAGLFRHSYRGRVLGSAILHNLDAQVDYLVSELRTAYSAVDRVLRNPAVTVEQAADAVLLRFEVPAAVLNRPVSHPQVQQVLATRRTAARRALQAYQSAQHRPAQP